MALQRGQGCWPSKVRSRATEMDRSARLPSSMPVQASDCKKAQWKPMEQASARAVISLGNRWDTLHHTAIGRGVNRGPERPVEINPERRVRAGGRRAELCEAQIMGLAGARPSGVLATPLPYREGVNRGPKRLAVRCPFHEPSVRSVRSVSPSPRPSPRRTGRGRRPSRELAPSPGCGATSAPPGVWPLHCPTGIGPKARAVAGGSVTLRNDSW